MSEKKPVVVYGASGYTGRLVCEYLREYNIPFLAAGRSAEKLDAAMKGMLYSRRYSHTSRPV